jgi:hypothetical protein
MVIMVAQTLQDGEYEEPECGIADLPWRPRLGPLWERRATTADCVRALSHGGLSNATRIRRPRLRVAGLH